jgi:hypothetical protein
MDQPVKLALKVSLCVIGLAIAVTLGILAWRKWGKK